MSESKIYSMYLVLFAGSVNKIILGFKLWMRKLWLQSCIREPAHITLVPPFWFNDAEEQSLLDVLSAFTDQEEELDIQLSNFSHFKNRVIFVQVQETPGLNLIKKRQNSIFIRSPPES